MSYTELCPYCLGPDPTVEHIRACMLAPGCLNCGMVAGVHSVAARQRGRALGLLVLSCDAYRGPGSADLGPQKKVAKVMARKRVDRAAAGSDEGKQGRRARAQLRNIAKAKPKTVKRDARGRKLPRYCDCRNGALGSCLYNPCRQPPPGWQPGDS